MSNGPVRLHAVGDIGIVGRIAEALPRESPAYPFDLVTEVLPADLLFGNLEIPLSGGATIAAGESPRLETPEAAVDRLALAGFHVLSLANNHVMDFGRTGLARTRELLAERGIETVGAGGHLAEARRPVLLERDGIRVGFLAYCVPCHATATADRPGAAPLDLDLVREDVASLRPKVECAVVSVHFGMMYLEHPTPEDMELARAIIDAGADVVLGHHPHVLQGVDEGPAGIIAYSLGEFVFDPEAGHYYARVGRDSRRRSMIFRATIDRQGATVLQPVPTLTDDRLAPRPLEGSAAEEALTHLRHLSSALHDPTERDHFWDYAGRRLLEYQLSGLWFEIRRGNLRGIARRFPRLRLRHLKLFLGYLRERIRGARASTR